MNNRIGAGVLYERGELKEASHMYKECIRQSESGLDPPDPAYALDRLANLELDEGRVEDAEIANRPAPKHDFSVPRGRLQGVISSAHRLGYYTIECEARLALDELEIRVDPLSGRAHLSALSAEARRRGMELISHEADALQNASHAAASMPHGLRASTAHP